MAARGYGPRKPRSGEINTERLDRIVAEAHKDAEARMRGYREQSLRLHPWVCARCGREFTRANLHELTVHHKDHNHDNNPPDGSNWENLCLYCHDWEHQKYSQQVKGANADFGLTAASHDCMDAGGRATHGAVAEARRATHSPFANLREALEKKK